MIIWEILYWGGVLEIGTELSKKGRPDVAIDILAGALEFILQEEGICSG